MIKDSVSLPANNPQISVLDVIFKPLSSLFGCCCKHVNNVPLTLSDVAKNGSGSRKSEEFKGAEHYCYGINKTPIDLVSLSKNFMKYMRTEFKLKASNKSYGNNDDLINEKKLELYSQKSISERMSVDHKNSPHLF